MKGPEMTCERAREILWPARRPTLAEGECEEARRHVATCSECQEFLTTSDQVALAYEELAQVQAPAELRERVFTAIACERAGVDQADQTSRLPWARWARLQRVGVAAVTVIALGSGFWLGRPAPASEAAVEAESGAAFVEDYLRRAVGEERILTSDPMAIRHWLARELGLQVEPLQLEGFALELAEICLLNGQRAAMLQYAASDGAQVSHYLVPRAGAGEREPAVGTQGAGGPVPPLVTWSTPSLEQALVGDLDPAELLRIARTAF